MAKRGPKTVEGKARSLANLKPPWKPGEQPPFPGRKNAGATVKERFNAMQDLPVTQLEAVASNPASPVSDVAAANQWLRAKDRGDELQRILEQTDGKPAQSSTVTHQGPDGGPVEVESRHSFNHDRFADLYQSGRPRTGRNGDRAANGNGHQ